MRILTTPCLAGEFEQMWRTLSAGKPAQMSAAWLRSQHGRIADTHRYHFLVDDDGCEALAAAACMIIDRNQTDVSFRLDSQLLAKGVGEQSTSASRLGDSIGPTYVCAIGSAHLPGLVAKDHLPKGALSHLIAHLESEAVANGAEAIAFFNFEESRWPELEAAFAETDYLKAVFAGETLLPLRGVDGFSGYLERLPRQRRRTVRHEIRTFSEQGMELSSHAVEHLTTEAEDLIVAHQERYGWTNVRGRVRNRIERTEKFFPGMEFLFARDSARELVGIMGLVAEPGGGSTAAIYGSRRNGAFVYFNMFYYERIRRALVRGCHELRFGTQTYRAKVARGCEVRPLYTFFKVFGDCRGLTELVAHRNQVEIDSWQNSLETT
ncbi:peptidogalycan biosysnthesis protein [Catenulispora pinisilvae]|uniref:peptidogalycan biosysnthesis protein n=1 Tax=Catenulispora pinisilvae TaxID=2705253 RepID=UPI0018922E06|nr:peptidogalycan biosysnthesis protein [Catenulispora pinisilvae]